jgi:hypothetical protein
VGDQQNQAEVDDTDDPMDKEATEALPATPLEIDKHRFRLRGIRAQQPPGRQTKTTQYRVVWGEHPNGSDSWVNEDDVQILMPRLPCLASDSLKTRFHRKGRCAKGLERGFCIIYMHVFILRLLNQPVNRGRGRRLHLLPDNFGSSLLLVSLLYYSISKYILSWNLSHMLCI